MKRYERYKPSNVEWIGEIPEHWEAKKLKYCFDFVTGFTPSSGVSEYYDGKYIWITIADMTNKYLDDSKQYIADKAIKDCNAIVVPKGSLLYSFKLSIGKVAFADVDLYTNEAIIAILENKEIDLNYLYYSLPKQVIHNANENIYGAKLLNQDLIKNAFIVIPSIDEQKYIANYLDKKTTEIEELIADKENLISLLGQEKELTISNAVTKGLNPNVPMKDSKFKWIGEIPEHWDTVPIKFCVQIPVTDGPHETPEFYPQGIPFISAEAIKDDKINFEKIRGYISLEDHIKYSKKYKPLRNDIYMIKSGATTGNIAMVETDEEFNIWSPLAVIRANEGIVLPKYAFYYMKSMNFFESVKLGWSYGTQQNIGMGVIENLLFCIPNNIEEQEQIVEYLDKKIAETNETVQIIKDEIELLKEYKETLIYEVITGKIDVRAEI